MKEEEGEEGRVVENRAKEKRRPRLATRSHHKKQRARGPPAAAAGLCCLSCVCVPMCDCVMIALATIISCSLRWPRYICIFLPLAPPTHIIPLRRRHSFTTNPIFSLFSLVLHFA